MISRFFPRMTSSLIRPATPAETNKQAAEAKADADETLAAMKAQKELMRETEFTADKIDERTGDRQLADLDCSYKENIAIVYMQTEADGRHYFQAFHPRVKKETSLLASIGDGYSLQSLVEGRNFDQVLGKLKRFSRREDNTFAFTLSRWVKNIREKVGEDLCCLVIYDSTGLEIPWEMTYVDDSLLGATIPIVRWHDIRVEERKEEGEEKLSDISSLKGVMPEVICQGEIVAYVNIHAKNSTMKEDIKVLEPYAPKTYERFVEFERHIRKHKSTNTGMVFVASHGNFEGGVIKEISIDTPTEKGSSRKLSLDDLCSWDWDDNLFLSSDSIVFFNTCHSARLANKEDSDSPDSSKFSYRWEGWATLFLEMGAKGFIGTLTEVEEDKAAIVARLFFEEYEKDPSLTVPEILRNVRRGVEAKNKDSLGEFTALMFCASTYTYYGQPMAKLALTKRGEQDA